MTIKEFKEKHPKVVKAAKIAVSCASVIFVASQCGLRVTTREYRENEIDALGYANDLKNAALGAEAKGLDATSIWGCRQSIIDDYVS